MIVHSLRISVEHVMDGFARIPHWLQYDVFTDGQPFRASKVLP